MLGIYWVTALVGFAFGQFLGSALSLSLLPIGSVNIIEGTVMSVIALLAARTLAQHYIQPA